MEEVQFRWHECVNTHFDEISIFSTMSPSCVLCPYMVLGGGGWRGTDDTSVLLHLYSVLVYKPQYLTFPLSFPLSRLQARTLFYTRSSIYIMCLKPSHWINIRSYREPMYTSHTRRQATTFMHNVNLLATSQEAEGSDGVQYCQ